MVGTEEVEPDGQGNYTVTPQIPTKSGKYEVTAVAPDGRGTAQAKFRAIDPGNLGVEADSRMLDALDTATAALAAAETQIE